MKRTSRLLALWLLAVAPLIVQGAESNPAALEAEVRTVEGQRLAAMVAVDVETLDGLLDGCLEYEHSNGTIDTKDTLLDSLRSGAVRYTAIQPADMEVHMRGPDVAEVRARAEFQVIAGDRTLDLDLTYTATWNLISDQWKMVAYQSQVADD